VNAKNGILKHLAGNYEMWRLYHLLVADAMAIQRPTKYGHVRAFLGDSLGVAADIGCGPGAFIRYMSARAKHVVAADIDCDSLDRVKLRHKDLNNVEYIAASAGVLPFSDEHLDTILLLEVLEHLVDDNAAVLEMRRVLRPGGRLVVSVPVPPGEVNHDSAWGHKREGYQLRDIMSLLTKNGFEVEGHAFAEFKFSRRAAQAIRWWRRVTRLPAPIFLAWIAYLDHFLESSKAQTGGQLPATVVVLARKRLEA
jgi:ubiquinone/menaquinone biosynthesis C-methylase UbiE